MKIGMTGIELRPVCDGVNFRSIQDSRFKTERMSIHFLLPLKKDSVSANAILPFLLTRASRKYPDYTKLNEHLEELYGAVLGADVQKLGDIQVLSISASGIADRYSLKKEPVAAELSRLLCSMVFDPPFQDGLFPEDGFAQERRQLIETLRSEFNDKRSYALRRCEEIMCAAEPYGIGRCGTEEDIRALERKDLTKAWSEMIHRARVEIMVLGDCDPNPVFENFSAVFRSLGRGPAVGCETKVVRSAARTSETAEKMNVAQSKLVLGFRTGIAEPDAAVPAVKLMSAVFGGTPNSKLFLNVREKLSLCYYCSSVYYPIKGILMVQSGVETKNINRAREEILHQLEEVRNGNFTDDELKAAKLSLCNSYRTLGDSLDGLEAWYLSKTFFSPGQLPEEEAARVGAVTREEVRKAAGDVTLDTVYCLEGSEASAE